MECREVFSAALLSVLVDEAGVGAAAADDDESDDEVEEDVEEDFVEDFVDDESAAEEVHNARLCRAGRVHVHARVVAAARSMASRVPRTAA